MTPMIVALVVISAALHPLREFFIKGDRTPEGVTFAVIVYFGLLATLHLTVKGVDFWSALVVWDLVLISSTGVVAYYICLVAAMRTGDLSIYYPITRSSPLFIVIVSFTFLGQRYPWMMLAGIALVLIGAFLIQYRRGTGLFHQPRTLAAAALAMCFHGVITLADAEAMRHVEPMAFMFLQYLILIPVMALVFSATRPAGRSVYQHLAIGWLRTPVRFFLAGFTAYVSYFLILTSFQMGGDAAAVSSVRQISVPFSVLLGGLILKEARMTGRLAWSSLLAAGIVLIIFSK